MICTLEFSSAIHKQGNLGTVTAKWRQYVCAQQTQRAPEIKSNNYVNITVSDKAIPECGLLLKW